MMEDSGHDEGGTPEQPQTKELISQMRALIGAGTKRLSRESSDEVARKANLLAVRFANETDDTLALQCVALISVAAIKGSKEAAKRRPKATRWQTSTPPSLEALASDEERRAAIKFFGSMKAPWVVSYALHQAANLAIGKETVADLIKWAYASAATSSEFVAALAAALRYGVANPDRIALVLNVSL